MNQLIQIAFSLTVFAIGALPASACCLWPFGGMWGAGYNGTPVSAGYYGSPVSAGYYGSPGYYSAGYAPWSTGSYGGVYSSGYASTGGCCVPSCCDPCGGACASGSCAGSTGSGTLKPETDQNFGRGTKDPEYDRDRTNPREPDPLDDPLDRSRNSRSKLRTEEAIPGDDFGVPANRTDPDSDVVPFGTGTDSQINKKPPMSEIQDLPATDPPETGDGKTFLPPMKEETPSGSQTRRESRSKSLAEQSSGLSEVIRSKRLASRSLPAIHRNQPATSFAGRSNGDNSGFNPPVRWISVPMPEGHVRL